MANKKTDKLAKELYKLLKEEEKRVQGKKKRKKKAQPSKKKSSGNQKVDYRELYELILQQEERANRPVTKKKFKPPVSANEIYDLLLQEEKRIKEPVRKRVVSKKPKRNEPDEELGRDSYPVTTVQPGESKLRYKGKFISKEFAEVIEAAAMASGKNPQKLLDDVTNEPYIDDVLLKGKTTGYKTSESIAKIIEGRNEVVIFDGENYTTYNYKEALGIIVSFDSKVKRRIEDIVYMGLKVEQFIDGTIIVYVPTAKRLTEEELRDFMDSYTEYLEYET